ncbi:hypothetical protein [Endozoicomonas montiporae]|uniref:Uncharacterized protein n=1 Tax=Endozoicomonas montiporae CL-33 TaxID=570277 RepID=A0A142B9R2_9GAMM|nr:hypothetical protein [Endozoicomonas montiporae]AMO55488.1 hypothetical protein EZMO1_1297 [Endozoicomonas montiporae CL-33]
MISKELFLKALGNNKAVRAQDMELLTAWFALPERAATAEQVVEVTGAKRASLIINNLGKRIAGFLEVEPEGSAASVIALEGSVGEEPAWVLREEMAAALIESGSVATTEETPVQETPVQETTVHEASVQKNTVEVEVVVEKAATPETAEPNHEDAEPGSLKAVLIEYDQTVVRAAYPQTPAANRLLSPEMIDALISNLPASKRVYQRVISAELRKKVSTQESNRFLQPVLKLLQANA